MLSSPVYLSVLLVSFLSQNVLAQTSAVAIFNFGGVTGTIRFVQNQGSVEITVDLQNVEYHDSWHIHTLPVDLSINPQIRCSDDLIGQPYDPLNATQSNDNYEANCTSNITYCAVGDLYRKFGRIPTERTTLTDDTGLLSLTGRFGIIGRSVKIHSINSSFIDVCATIFSVDAVENGSRVVFVESYLVSPIAGNIYWYQVEGGDTQIWGNLFWVTAMSSTVNHSWSILNDQPSLLYHEGDCSGVGGIFNPTQVNRDAPSYVNCTPENAEVCAIGDLSRKHGLLDIADAPGSNSFFFTDTTVDLMGQNSVIGNTIVIYESDENSPIVACAPLEVVTTLSIWDIFGEFSAFSDSFYIDTFARTSLDTSQLTLLSFVVAPNQLCHVALTSPNVSVYNPFDVTTPRGRAITPDQLAVGDISGKNFTSPGILPEFPIHGISTTALRSLGYRIGDGDNYQEVCTALMPLYQVPTMLMAKASFEGSVSGAIYFTNGHNWHVHEYPPVANQECSGTIGGHFNPFSVNISQDQYPVECSPSHQLRCASGDLSGKHGQLQLSPGIPSRESYFFIDLNLNLYGPENYSIINRSIGLHLPSSEGGALFQCAEIKRTYRASEFTNWTITTTSDFERTSFVTSLTRNLDDVRPDDIVLMRQHNFATEHSGPEDPIIVTINAAILGSSVERANTNQELLQAEIDALNNPPTTTSPLTTSGNGVLAFSFWTIFVLQCVMAFAHY